MKKLLLTTAVLSVLSAMPAYARDFSECQAVPYGSTNWHVEKMKPTQQEAIRKICLGQAGPGSMRDALRAIGFTDKEIEEKDPGDLYDAMVEMVVQKGEECRAKNNHSGYCAAAWGSKQ